MLKIGAIICLTFPFVASSEISGDFTALPDSRWYTTPKLDILKCLQGFMGIELGNSPQPSSTGIEEIDLLPSVQKPPVRKFATNHPNPSISPFTSSSDAATPCRHAPLQTLQPGGRDLHRVRKNAKPSPLPNAKKSFFSTFLRLARPSINNLIELSSNTEVGMDSAVAKQLGKKYELKRDIVAQEFKSSWFFFFLCPILLFFSAMNLYFLFFSAERMEGFLKLGSIYSSFMLALLGLHFASELIQAILSMVSLLLGYYFHKHLMFEFGFTLPKMAVQRFSWIIVNTFIGVILGVILFNASLFLFCYTKGSFDPLIHFYFEQTTWFIISHCTVLFLIAAILLWRMYADRRRLRPALLALTTFFEAFGIVSGVVYFCNGILFYNDPIPLSPTLLIAPLSIILIDRKTFVTLGIFVVTYALGFAYKYRFMYLENLTQEYIIAPDSPRNSRCSSHSLTGDPACNSDISNTIPYPISIIM